MISLRAECPEPGIYHDVDFATYRSWSAMNVSILRWAEKSAKHLRAAMLGEMESRDTVDRRFGRAMHCRVLEPDQFAWRFPISGGCEAEIKTGENKGRQCGRIACARADGRWYCGAHSIEGAEKPDDYVTRDESLRLEKLAHELKSHKVVNLLRKHGGCEVSWVADIDGVRMKGRCDKYVFASANWPATIIDVKKCRVGSVGTEEARKAIANYGYHVQAACYREAMRQLEGVGCEVFWIFIEDDSPYDINVLHAEDVDMEIGMSDLHRWLGIYNRARETNRWPGCCEDINEGALPGWYRKTYLGSYA